MCIYTYSRETYEREREVEGGYRRGEGELIYDREGVQNVCKTSYIPLKGYVRVSKEGNLGSAEGEYYEGYEYRGGELVEGDRVGVVDVDVVDVADVTDVADVDVVDIGELTQHRDTGGITISTDGNHSIPTEGSRGTMPPHRGEPPAPQQYLHPTPLPTYSHPTRSLSTRKYVPANMRTPLPPNIYTQPPSLSENTPRSRGSGDGSSSPERERLAMMHSLKQCLGGGVGSYEMPSLTLTQQLSGIESPHTTITTLHTHHPQNPIFKHSSGTYTPIDYYLCEKHAQNDWKLANLKAELFECQLKENKEPVLCSNSRKIVQGLGYRKSSMERLSSPKKSSPSKYFKRGEIEILELEKKNTHRPIVYYNIYIYIYTYIYI